MARKGWDALSDAYRDRLVRGGISQSDYESGTPLHRARGHLSARLESFASQTSRFSKRYTEHFPERQNQVMHYIRHMGVSDGRSYMRDVREMVRLYERGDTEAARALWDQRDQSLPDYMYFYHGVFAY